MDPLETEAKLEASCFAHVRKEESCYGQDKSQTQ